MSKDKITSKQLRSFGVTVGDIFALDWPLAGRLPPRQPSMVGHSGGGVSSRSRCRVPKKSSLRLQRMDGGRPCHGLDQHENYSRSGLLHDRDSHGNRETLFGKRSHGSATETQPRKVTVLSAIPDRLPI